MAAASIDKFKRTSNQTATTLSAPGHTSGGTTITVGSTSRWPTTTGVVFAIDMVTLNGTEEVQVPNSYTLWNGVVTSATTIGSMVLSDESPNSDQDYPAGSLTRVYMPVSAGLHNDLVEGLLVEHTQTGTHGAVTATSVTAPTISGTTSVSDAGQTLQTYRSEYLFDFVASGCVWSGDAYGSTRNASMGTGGASANVVYIGGKRVVVANVTARAFTASKDTYIDVDNTGTLVYTEVANNAASPALAANSIRLGIIVTGASNIANVGSVNQGQENKVLPIASSIPYMVTDSLGNLICPRDPQRKVLGYKQIIANQTSIGTTATQVTGLSIPVIVPAGRKVYIKVFAWAVDNGLAGTNTMLTIWDGAVGAGTQIGASLLRQSAASNGTQQTAEIEVTPSSTSKTYNIGLHGSASTSGIFASAGNVTFAKVELI